MLKLKPLAKEAIPAALEKARHYRLLNEPSQAESICLDILEVEKDHEQAIITLILTLSDLFDRRLTDAFPHAKELIARLTDDYSRAYYRGLISERRARASLKRGGPGADGMAHDWFQKAMAFYDQAAEIRPPGNDDALLRWNTCARTLNSHPQLAPEPEDHFRPLLE